MKLKVKLGNIVLQMMVGLFQIINTRTQGLSLSIEQFWQHLQVETNLKGYEDSNYRNSKKNVGKFINGSKGEGIL